MTLIELLAQDLLRWMEAASDGVSRRVLLWLDPESQFKRLAAHLESVLLNRDAQFLRCEAAERAG